MNGRIHVNIRMETDEAQDTTIEGAFESCYAVLVPADGNARLLALSLPNEDLIDTAMDAVELMISGATVLAVHRGATAEEVEDLKIRLKEHVDVAFEKARTNAKEIVDLRQTHKAIGDA